MARQKIKILSEKDYKSVMQTLDGLMKKGEKNLSEKELQEVRALALAAEEYEKSIYTIPAPKTLEGLIELKMYERKLKQKDLAKLLDITEPKLSQIMSRKRKPDVAFLKAARFKLGIDGNLLLEYV